MKKTLIACSILVASAGLMRAQIANNTSLVGNVIDASGGAIAGAAVTAVEESTRVRATATTDGVGYYAVAFIAPGTYDITVDQTGYKKITKTGVIVPQRQQPVRKHRVLRGQ